MLNKKDILEYADDLGDRAGADLLLLAGYDGFDGTVDEYDALMKFLEERDQKGW